MNQSKSTTKVVMTILEFNQKRRASLCHSLCSWLIRLHTSKPMKQFIFQAHLCLRFFNDTILLFVTLMELFLWVFEYLNKMIWWYEPSDHWSIRQTRNLFNIIVDDMYLNLHMKIVYFPDVFELSMQLWKANLDFDLDFVSSLIFFVLTWPWFATFQLLVQYSDALWI